MKKELIKTILEIIFVVFFIDYIEEHNQKCEACNTIWFLAMDLLRTLNAFQQ